MSAKSLAKELKLTTMGVRQHLQLLEDESHLVFEDKKAARGRPTRYWSLTEKGDGNFANGHEELTLQLITSVKTIFGDEGLNKLINHREQTSFNFYQQAINKETDLLSKLTILAQLRSDEGYMANIEDTNGCYWLIENHCPICAAATQCQNFCRSELELFQALLKSWATVNREEHIIDGARRCTYKIMPYS